MMTDNFDFILGMERIQLHRSRPTPPRSAPLRPGPHPMPFAQLFDNIHVQRKC